MSLIITKERIFWIDVCRVIAIFGVVLIHSCGEIFYSYGKIPASYWLAANILDSFARVAVPLFVMISGALLLRPNNSPSVNLKNIGSRIGKVLLPLIIWSMFYLWWVDYNTPNKIIDPLEWLQKFLSQPVMYHLWFVYMIIGIYILLPILQVIFTACNTNSKFKWYFLVIGELLTASVFMLKCPSSGRCKFR